MERAQPKSLLIFPCNGNAIEALDCLGSEYRMIGFIDDTTDKQGTAPFGHSVFARASLQDHPEAQVLAVPGSPTSFPGRRAVIESLHLPEERYARVIHPMARVSPHATIGHNVLIMAGAVITSNATIGNHVCILPNTVIHHDTVIGDWTLIGSNVTIAGGAKVGMHCYIGSGSSVINGAGIGDGTLVGLGSNVIRSLPEHARVVGNPARPL